MFSRLEQPSSSFQLKIKEAIHQIQREQPSLNHVYTTQIQNYPYTCHTIMFCVILSPQLYFFYFQRFVNRWTNAMTGESVKTSLYFKLLYDYQAFSFFVNVRRYWFCTLSSSGSRIRWGFHIFFALIQTAVVLVVSRIWRSAGSKIKYLIMGLWGITTEFVGFIPQSLVLKSVLLGSILIYWNWSILEPIVVICKDTSASVSDDWLTYWRMLNKLFAFNILV